MVPGDTPPIRPPLPRLILIADGFTDPDVMQRARTAVMAGVRWVHLRDHGAAEDAFATAAQAFTERLSAEAPGVLISINGRLAVAQSLGAGFHTGRHGPALEEARRLLERDRPVGYSAHSVEEGRRAVDAGADYLFFSPIFPTGSKPGSTGAGLDGLRLFAGRFPGTPVYALGAITPERVKGCLEAGAYGIAVLGGILKAADPARAVRAYLDALDDITKRSGASPN